MMTRIEAEEALARIAQIAAGNGTMPERDQRSYLRALRRAAAGGKREPVVKATVASLQRIGIKVTTLPPAEQQTQAAADKVAETVGGGESG